MKLSVKCSADDECEMKSRRSLVYHPQLVAVYFSEIRESVLRLYKKIESLGFDMIHQTGFRGASGVIEYVRPEDILAILYRLKSIGFKER